MVSQKKVAMGTESLTGAEILGGCLSAGGVKHVSGYRGGSLLSIHDLVADSSEPLMTAQEP